MQQHHFMPNKHSFTYTIVALLTFLYLPNAQAEEPWTLIAVPDIQHYVDDPDNVDDLMTQMRWIADNISTYGVAFVTQLGDVVQHGDQIVEWDRAENGIDVIHGLVPYSVSIGDHDYRYQEKRDSGSDEFVRRFGAARYQGNPWYGGSSPDEKSHFQLFSAGGRQFLHLNLEWEASGSVSDPESPLGWAKQVLDAHPQTPTIVSTHSYVWDEVGEKGRTNGVEEDSGDGSSGELIWSELIRNSPQVFMVLNGNFHEASSQYDPGDPGADPAGPSFDGEYHQISTNLHGLPVYEMLSNYQDYPNGGDGWIRLIQFQPGAGQGGVDRISVQTYSTTHDAYQTDSVSQFHFDLRFAERFDDIPAALDLARTTLRTGEDTYVWKKRRNQTFGSDSLTRLESSGRDSQQGLVRFDIDFGGTIPAGAEIVSAQLRLGLTDSGSGFQLNRMLVPWSEDTATWNSFTDGIDDDGTEAAAQPDHVTFEYLTESESDCLSIFDVTESVRAWQQGGANHGWALLPLGSDDLTVRSFDSSSFRPELVVDYILSGSRQVKVTTGEDAYLWKNEPQTNFGTDNRIRVDLSDGMGSDGVIQPMQGLIRFDVPFGDSSAGGIPDGATILGAQLRLRLTDSGDGFRLHRMLVPWSEGTATWNSFTDGIDDDGVEAEALPDVITSDYLEEPSTPSYLSFDVTDAVRAWHAGQDNRGWALLPLGDNKLLIESLQGSDLTPELVIQYAP